MDFNSFSLSFIFNEILQLVKTPVANPIIHSLAKLPPPYSFEVFHNYLISFKIGNNLLAYVMIDPSHKPFLPARYFFKQSLGRYSAFGLKLSTQELEFPFNLFDFGRFKKLCIRSDRKIVYSKINAENPVIDIVLDDIYFFGKSEKEKTPTIFVNSQKTFFNVPSEIFTITLWNTKWNFNSTLDCSQTQNIVFERSASWDIIPNACSFDHRLSFGFPNHSTGLLDTSDSKLRLQAHSFDISINERMEIDIVFNLILPCNINAELQSFGIDFGCLDYLWNCFYLDFSCCNAPHTKVREDVLYKSYMGMSSGMITSHTKKQIPQAGWFYDGA